MPTRDTPWPNGTPCWVDYGASDLEATKNFYADLLGWEYTGGEPEFGGYLPATRNGAQAGGDARPRGGRRRRGRQEDRGRRRKGRHGAGGHGVRPVRGARGPVGCGVLG